MLQELAEKFHALEKDNHLFDLKIKGHPFWEYMRYSIFEEINRAKSCVQFPVRKRSYFQKAGELAQYFIYRFACLMRKQRKFDILLFTHTRTALIDGRKVYFHTYPLAKALSKLYNVMIAHRHEFQICKSDYPCPVMVIRPLYLFGRLKSYFVKFNAEEQSTFARLGCLINTTFNTNIDIHSLARRIYAVHLASYNEFVRFFKIYKPSVIIYCDSGEMKPILKAAHEEGIKAIDYQHGIISPMSLLYRYPKEFHWEKLKETNADYVFTFGDYWIPFFTTPSRPVSVGFPYFDLCRKKPDAAEKREKNILITSVLSSRKALVQLALDLANCLPNHSIYFRRRPEEHDFLESIYPEEFIRKSNIKIVGGCDSSLYDDFAKCHYLISTNSMTLYEGVASGLVTFVFKAEWYDEAEDFYQKGYALLVSSAKEIVESIQNRKNQSSFMPTEHFFRTNSINHVESFLSSILSQREAVSP